MLAKLSKSFIEKLESLNNKGYKPIRAKIGYVVAWQGEEDDNETAIILPVLYLEQEPLNENKYGN